MKNLNVKKVKFQLEENKKSDTLDLIVFMMKVRQKEDNGFTSNDVINRFRIIDRVKTLRETKKELKTVSFEDQDAKFILSVLEEMKWGVVDEDIKDFIIGIRESFK